MPENYPIKHISIRVPWTDSGWDGTVCHAPTLNSSCLILDRVSPKKDDSIEHCLNHDFTKKNKILRKEKNAGLSIENLEEEMRPACVGERMAFMSPFDYQLTIRYPFVFKENLNHFLPTKIKAPKYSAFAVPFFWLSKKGLKAFLESDSLPVSEELEKEFEEENSLRTDWVNTLHNQKLINDWFFGHIKPEKSLCFFYAKQVPFVEDQNRIIIGVGRVKGIDPEKEYDYSTDKKYRGLIWERAVHHSIRPEFHDGFLLPYHQALKMLEENPDLDFDPYELAVFAPKGKVPEFSYVSELVSNDSAIDVLLACAESLKKAINFQIRGPWEDCIRWINNQLDEIWKMRGPCPGLGSVLTALGISLGNFIAWEMEEKREEGQEPWNLLEKVFENPSKFLSSGLKADLEDFKEIWEVMSDEEKDLVKLVSRFDLNSFQAEIIIKPEIREKLGLKFSDNEILDNPYLISEISRHTEDPISFLTVDHGVLPDSSTLDKYPLPNKSKIDSKHDWRRIRALIVDILEDASLYGNSLLPQDLVIEISKERQLDPPCNLNEKMLRAKEKYFSGVIEKVQMANGKPAYQLNSLSIQAKFIKNKILSRKKGKRNLSDIEWEKLLHQIFEDRHGSIENAIDPEAEKIARAEKAAALREIAESRISVLTGSAGTGKTTLLSILCHQKEIKNKGVLLLAPTGKARVKMEQALGISSRDDPRIQVYNVAQFLIKSKRYNGVTGRYSMNDEPPKKVAGTIIIDESSMLTEEMLAAILQSIKGYERLILVGDQFQLPPIGTGRPFVDIIKELEPENFEDDNIRIGPGFAELTQNRRQITTEGVKREDIQLAKWFRGGQLGVGEDEIFDVLTGALRSDFIKIKSWSDPDEFSKLIFEVLQEELNLKNNWDYKSFNNSLGAVNGSFKVTNSGYIGSAEHAEDWQILSPVRNRTHGVSEINRMLHKHFKGAFVRKCLNDWGKPNPAGVEEIVWGDKVINIRNQSIDCWNSIERQKEDGYLANGEIGLLVDTPKINNKFHVLKFEFASQLGLIYSFFTNLTPMDKKFKRKSLEEESPSIELAYALTVHKAQGSEFGKVILVIPRNSFTMSRELIYTALTRQKDGIVIIYEGDPKELMYFSDEKWSETNKRFTNIFQDPNPREVKDKKNLFLEDRLINRTLKGEDVRSKSELVIANMMHSNGIDYEYEPVLEINGETRRPDFVIYDDDSGETYYWEHLGMCQNRSYREAWKRKEYWYRKNDILPYKEGGGKNGILITTRDTKKGGINSQKINDLIKIIKGEL